jgi:uncharacterized membrane protein
VEALGILFGLALLGLLLLAPILAIVAMVRVSRLATRLTAAEAALQKLRRSGPSERRAPASEPRSEAPAPVTAPAVPAPALTRPAEPTIVARPHEAPPRPGAPPERPTAPPTPPAATVGVETVRAPVPAAVPREAAPARPVQPTPARPSAPAAAQVPEAPAPPAFDWESLLGLKGAAWLGGITLVITSLFFAKWAIDQGYFGPELRFATLVAAGIGALVWAEISLHRGFKTAAHAVSGAGIAILYVAFYSGHALYDLLPLWLTFAAMAATTAVAGLLAIRYDAMFTAVLGLLGGFATPVALSTGVDHAVGFFSYLLLLNGGLAVVALRKRWHPLFMLAFAGTFALELGWFAKFMSPEKALVGLGAFLLIGLLYLLLPLVSGRDEDASLGLAAAVGGLAPFLFGLMVAGQSAFAGEWPLLFGYVALLDAALLGVALARGRTILLVGGASATAALLPLWAGTGLRAEELWGPSLAAMALGALLNAGPRLPRAWRRDESTGGLQLAGVLGVAGLASFAAVLVGKGLGDPPWVFLTLLLALTALVLERTQGERWPGTAVTGSLGLAVLVQFWFFRHPESDNVLRDLAPGLLLVCALSAAAALRTARGWDATEDEVGVLMADGAAVLGLFVCLAIPGLGRDPLPMFAGLAVAVLLALGVMARRGWSALAPLALAASALFGLVWQEAHFQRTDVAFALPVYLLFAQAFLTLPFVLRADRWRKRGALWASAALAYPAFFLPVHQAVVAVWGKAWIGAVPVAMAAATVVALVGVSRHFPPAVDAVRAHARLRYLALFATVALGFLAIAIPLQLDRQWITIGWALLAAAVCWLFGRLPHPGLKYVALGLFTAVGARLLLNDQVFRYQERGLPIVNWLLYTYGVPALCAFAGAFFLRRAEAERGEKLDYDVLPGDRGFPPVFALLGLLLVFALVNVEIFDWFSEGPYVQIALERQFKRDLALSAAWALYALGLLVIGIWRRSRALRGLALGFLSLTVLKVFFYDLGQLHGLERILSFFGLGISLIFVSLLYQRFVFGKEKSA